MQYILFNFLVFIVSKLMITLVIKLGKYFSTGLNIDLIVDFLKDFV